MIIRKAEPREASYLQTIADYQFWGAGPCILSGDLSLGLVAGGKPRYIYLDGELAFVLRPSDGLLSLHLAGGRRIQQCLPPPIRRVVVDIEAAPHVCRGSNVFAGHVIGVDAWIRAGEEVIVVDEEDALLAVGKARLSAVEIYYFTRGEAVRVRKGACEYQ